MGQELWIALALIIGLLFITLTSPNRVSDWFWLKVFNLFKEK